MKTPESGLPDQELQTVFVDVPPLGTYIDGVCFTGVIAILDLYAKLREGKTVEFRERGIKLVAKPDNSSQTSSEN